MKLKLVSLILGLMSLTASANETIYVKQNCNDDVKNYIFELLKENCLATTKCKSNQQDCSKKCEDQAVFLIKNKICK